MTIVIPAWVLWTLAGLIGVPLLGFVCFFAYFGWKISGINWRLRW
jgi:hypothetical protein